MSSNSSAFKELTSCLNHPTSKSDKDTSFLLGNTASVRPSRTPSMSTRSLEMCTENLGNETGCTIDLNLDEYSYLLSERQSSTQTKMRKKNRISSRSFPPPLSSIKVQAHREGGRLRMTAFSGRTHFKSEREKGRLRLFVVKDDYGDVAENVKEDLAAGAMEMAVLPTDYQRCHSLLLFPDSYLFNLLTVRN